MAQIESRSPDFKLRLMDRWPLYYWRRYLHFLRVNGFSFSRVNAIPRGAVQQAMELGYLRWPKALASWCRDKDVVDVGCGMGLHGVGFLLEGARSYTGVDPLIKPKSAVLKSLHSGKRLDCGWTPEQLMERMERFRMIRGISNELEGKMQFDVATLHNATEHLTDLSGVFASVARLLRPGGRLIFSHHNWFSWNGHHQEPKTIGRLDLTNPDQQRFADWAHLTGTHAPDHYVMTKLNRLRLDEVRAITREHFEIETERVFASTPNQGAGRLTPAIQASHPELAESDFTTQSLFIVARLKG
jgi:SAM-dependent methyltransferase